MSKLLFVQIRVTFKNVSCLSGGAEVWVVADAVSLPGPEVVADAEESQTEISAGDEDEGVSL